MNRQALFGLMALEALLRHSADQQSKGESQKQKDLRGTGRSTSLALKQAHTALEAATRGSAIEVYDHHDSAEAHNEQAKRVSAVLRALGVDHTVCGNVIDVEPLKREPEQELPSWAVGINSDLQLVPGAQLITKDARRHGNAAISCMHEDERGVVYCVVTDIGNHIRVSKDELNEMFEVGDYLMDPQEVAARCK